MRSTTTRRHSTAIVKDYRAFAQQIGLANITCIPVSALKGDNIIERSTTMPWYHGPFAAWSIWSPSRWRTGCSTRRFRLPVQWVNRPNSDFRGFAGQITGGKVAAGDRIRALPSGKEARVARIVTQDGDLPQAVAGQSITLTLDREIDISRGDLLTSAAEPAAASPTSSQATLIWMHEQPMLPGPPVPAEDRHAHRHGHAGRAEATG